MLSAVQLVERALAQHLQSVSYNIISPALTSTFALGADVELTVSCNVRNTDPAVMDDMLDRLTQSLISFHISQNEPNTPTSSLIELVPKEKIIDDIIEDEVLWQTYLRYYEADNCIRVHKVNSKGDHNFTLQLS